MSEESRKYHIVVTGTGYVGLVTGVCLAHMGHQVTCVDINEEKIRLLSQGISPIYENNLEPLLKKGIAENKLCFTTDYESAYKSSDVIFIGVGTPEKPDGSADLSYIATAARQIAESIEKDCLVVIKSTVPIGTNDRVEQFINDFLIHDVKVEVASNPEFLAQGSAVHDTLNAARIIIGTDSPNAQRMLKEIYTPYDQPIVFMDRTSAEMTKYASNNFLALKISYINDIANLCELVGANVEDVARGMAYDERIGDRFLNAGVGYGGSCFPKDTKALIYLARQVGYDLKTVSAAVTVNSEQKLKLFEKAKDRLISFSGLNVAILGVTFKPGTDDLRESPALENIPLLLEAGAKIRVYDPAGVDNLKRIYPDEIYYADSPEQALNNANVCFIFAEWAQIKAIEPSKYTLLMRKALVYDGRNIHDPRKMALAGVEYYSIGRPDYLLSSSKQQRQHLE
ncbi:UDP-glucose/GDP-mannose dehydrogenase family protein [Eubacteriales bacterium OttesenSCG-928-M02]|nr:UDP-glucose/GDP-mannose dehydrogenase family protein [Eubacteriales bacterium OttesenSCG-928-M02]